MIPSNYEDLGLALVLGLLVGMQREWVAKDVAGIRTFALITLTGAVTGLLAEPLGPWPFVAGMLGLAAMLFVANLRAGALRPGDGNARGEQNEPEPDPPPGMGTTTEVAALLMFAVGAALPNGFRAEAIVVGGTVAVLLHLKKGLHRFVGRIDDADFRAIIQFVLITLVVLPVAPDRTMGPYSVLNPRELWLLVVLIVGMNLAGYLLYKVVTTRMSSVLGGLIGGIISSTATTVSAARQAAREATPASAAALVVAVSSVVVFGRVLVEIAVVAPSAFPVLAPPILAMTTLMALLAGAWLLLGRSDQRQGELAEQANPAQLKSALAFGATFALVLLAVAFARDRFGDRGMYIVAAISGLAKMDAIALSTAGLVDGGRIEAATGWRMIVVASMANMVFKAAIAGVLGGRRLFWRVALLFAVAIAGGGLLLWLWPG